MEPYLAMIMTFAGNFEIRGWAFCNGQTLSISTNTALFSILGTTYGGNGTVNFQLPDLRGRTAIGWGQGPGLSNYSIGETGGTESTTITINNMPAHTHVANVSSLSATPSASTAAGTSNTPGPNMVPAALPTIGGGPSATTIKGYAVKDNTTTLAGGAVSGSVTINPTGGTQPFSIKSPFLAVTYLIALEGIYPSRN